MTINNVHDYKLSPMDRDHISTALARAVKIADKLLEGEDEK